MTVGTYTYMYLSLSLSIYIYIYIYIHTHTHKGIRIRYMHSAVLTFFCNGGLMMAHNRCNTTLVNVFFTQM